jgi:GT2 family glycosyltransferase
MSSKREAAYKILEIEVEQPLTEVIVPKGYSGLGCVIRRNGKPVGFFMEAIHEGTVLSPREVAARIMKHASSLLLGEKIYEELRGPRSPRELPSLDIAICTHDRPAALQRCLRSLGPVRVLVIDNAPSDEQTRRVTAEFPNATYILEPKPGLDLARNRAVRESTAELLAFLDDDVVIDRRWLEGLREAWAENPDAGAFTGPVLPFELETRAQILFEEMGGFGRSFYRTRFGPVLPGLPTYPCGAGMFGAGCNMVFRRAILLELGGFDDALDTGAPLPGGGDLDMFYRVVRAGYPLVREPTLVVYHQHRREYAKLRHQMWTWGSGSMAFVSKSWKTDPTERAKIRRWVLWWVSYQLSKIFVPFLRSTRRPWRWDLAAAEIAGGMVGLFGEYGRSQNRIKLIRSLHL